MSNRQAGGPDPDAARAAAQELRDATRAAHEAMTDLRAVVTSARALLAELGPQVRAEFAPVLAEALAAALKAGQEQVAAEFDTWTAMLFGDDLGEGESIVDAAKRYVARQQDQGPATSTVQVTGDRL